MEKYLTDLGINKKQLKTEMTGISYIGRLIFNAIILFINLLLMFKTGASKHYISLKDIATH